MFDATPTHERDGPEAFLATVRAATCRRMPTPATTRCIATGRMREIGCWAHARRGFVEALTSDVRAALMVALIQQLYDVERASADLASEDRRRPASGALGPATRHRSRPNVTS